MFGHVLCLIVVLVVAYVALASQLFSLQAPGGEVPWEAWWDGHYARYSADGVKLYTIAPAGDGYVVAFPGRKPFKRKFGCAREARQFAQRLCV